MPLTGQIEKNIKSTLSEKSHSNCDNYDTFLFPSEFVTKKSYPYWNFAINFFQIYPMCIPSKYPQAIIFRVCMHTIIQIVFEKLVVDGSWSESFHYSAQIVLLFRTCIVMIPINIYLQKIVSSIFFSSLRYVKSIQEFGTNIYHIYLLG